MTEAPGSVLAQLLGQVSSQASLRIQQAGQVLLELPVAQLADCFEQAIPRRLGCGS